MNNQQLISIVTISYNIVAEIEATILSVLQQTYTNIEYIIIDGGSTDGTNVIIKKYNAKIDYWISEPDEGIYDAMNKAIDKATGDWIIFMNGGDTFYNENVLFTIFSENLKDYGVIYGDTKLLTDQNNIYRSRKPFYKRNSKYAPMGIVHQSIFVRVHLAKKYKFDLQYKVSADYNMIRTIYYDSIPFYYAKDVIISTFAIGGFSAQNEKIKKQEIAKICGVKYSWKYKAFDISLKIRGMIIRHIYKLSPALYSKMDSFYQKIKRK